MDTMSQILKRGRILNVIGWTAFASIMLALCYVVATSNEGFKDWRAYVTILVFFLLVVLTAVLAARQWFGRMHSTAQVWPPFLAIGSSMDEAWQILNHMRNTPNPLAIRSNVLSYLFSSMRSRMSRNKHVARIHRAKVGLSIKLVTAISYLLIFTAIIFNLVSPIKELFFSTDTPDWSKALSFALNLVATCALAMATYATVFLFPAVVTYVIRRHGWSVLQAMAMGFEGYTGGQGYRFQLPLVEQYPSYVPENCVKREYMPPAAEQRALERRRKWIDHELNNVAQTFSKLVVTSAEIDLLLHKIEADSKLVHAAYYTEDECIAQIAGWIAGRG
jgi:hypothetical protein